MTPVPISPGLQAAIVDLDGTLIDTLGDFVEALNRTLAQLRLPGVVPDEVARLVGKGSEHLIRSVLAQVGAAPDRYEDAWAAYQHHYRAINGRHAQVYPGAVRALEAMRACGWNLACLTNKPTDFARPLLEAKGLLLSFAHVFGGDAFERKKPDPLPILRTCEALGTLPSATLVIGDSSNDAQAARAAGCPVWLVTFGYNHGEPVRAVPAEGHFNSWADLCSALPAPSRAGSP
jgi:phosphoglycolate phosphatase